MAKNYVDFTQAVTASLQHAEATSLREIIGLGRALGRVFSQDVICQKNLPSFNNSAMDGFAIKAEDAGKTLRIKEVVYAGDVKAASLSEGECTRS